VFLSIRVKHVCWVCDIRINNCVGETNQKFFIQFLFYVGKWSYISVHLLLIVMTDLLQNFVHWFFSGWTPCTLLSLFDYCNCRMNAIVTTLTGRLQAVLHATIHLITGICLNYLSLRRQCLTCCTCFCQLIIYKTALIAFNCTWCQGPEYFNDVLVPVCCVGAHAWLWSADIGDMIVPHVYIPCIVDHTLCIY